MTTDQPDQPYHADRDARDARDDDADEGQVSEVAAMSGTDTETISPGDSVAGQPDGKSGRADEGPQGPNAVPDHDETHHG